MPLSTIKQSIKAEARRLGFTHSGVAAATPPPYFETYQSWIDQGYHAEMTYLSRPDAVEKRQDPRLILQDCQSVICLAAPYDPPTADAAPLSENHGRIAAYARMQDYHTILQPRLKALEKHIVSISDESILTKSYVDTGPVMEKAYALQAGIGSIGKNGCLIIPQWGSFFFLSVILTNLKLTPDVPISQDMCKSCSRCIDSCPTHCILLNRTIDANRCISYLTIENKNPIPHEQREAIGNWLFGCDVCQTVCPHNQNVINQKKQVRSIANPTLPGAMPLFPFFDLSEYTFRNQFKKTALYRSKREGIMRNAAIVIGNQKNPEALPILRKAKNKIKSQMVAEAIAWAISQITGLDAPARSNNSRNNPPKLQE